jgi:hypothetical protein
MEGTYQKVIDESKCRIKLTNLLDLKLINKVPEVVADHRILSKFRKIR